ncbi:MAG: GntR family transcriptional regulator [Bacteroidota bacterium]
MPFAIQINNHSSTPKYRQIANCISRGIERKIIHKEEQLPSINELSAVYDISRDTAEKAYRLLKNKGIIMSVRGKGYYATNSSPCSERRVLLIFNKLSRYKEAIYNGFVQTIGQDSWVDLQVYYEDLRLFERILQQKSGQFTDYVIIPSFKGEAALQAQQMIDRYLGGQKITLLNALLPGIKEKHRAVIQNYETDIYQALCQAHRRLSSYKCIKLHFPFDCNYSRGIIHGFQRYCLEKSIPSEIIYKAYEQQEVEAGTAYIVVRDEELVTLVNQIKLRKFRLSKEVGILAYNDSPLKQVLLNGISVMSTKHELMGRQAAQLVLENQWGTVENEFQFIERGSL